MKRIFLYILAFAVVDAAIAGILTARTSIELAKRQYNSRTATIKDQSQPLNGDRAVLHAIVTVDNANALSCLDSLGATVNAQFGNIATVTVPLYLVGELARISGVKSIDIERHYRLCNDKAREMSRFPSMTVTEDYFTRPAYTGNEVVVGMIDVGVDFNHVNFLDKDGNNRIVRAYLPGDHSGSRPIINGMELPGSEYITPEQIKLLTTDDSTETHGTHTTGTAAGSYLANGYNGVATGAQIVVCAMPEDSLTDFNIANSIRYIFNYADEVGLPAVINMSIGSQDGAHDGSSTLCRLFDEVSGPGRICVVSAGNDGDMPISIRKKMGEGDSLASFLSNWYSREPMRGYSSMWSRSPQRHTVDIVIWDIKADTLVHRLDVPREAELDSVYVVSSETDSVFAKYYTGELYFACTIESNGNFHSLVETNYKSLDRSHYRIGVINKAPQGETLMGWGGGMVVYSKCGLEGWTGGVVGYGCTVSDLATADKVISVGAYCSNSSFLMMDGDTATIVGCNPGEIAYFSGFGPDARNRRRPDLVAPGFEVASSVSRFLEAYKNPSNIVDNVNVNGECYPYSIDGGTSMSTPVVSGSIALWLEIDPTLSPSDLKNIMAATCYRDHFVEAGPAKKWGYGKLDIDAGIKYLLAKLEGDVDGDGIVTVADITCLYNIILGISNQNIQRADVDCDENITVADVSTEYNRILGQ
ncbi:MAG: S8 family serine peptidase [Muribaculaceae bacterium]|nr:S8 family serine peptidase [Muribaculaceae bacterium]